MEKSDIFSKIIGENFHRFRAENLLNKIVTLRLKSGIFSQNWFVQFN